MQSIKVLVGSCLIFSPSDGCMAFLLLGRAIRHGHDWASLVLLDRRYGATSIRNKLPKWIGNKLVITEGFGQTVKEMGTFYRNKKLRS